jgi:uncharacterized protein YegP (UPF0339 family)
MAAPTERLGIPPSASSTFGTTKGCYTAMTVTSHNTYAEIEQSKRNFQWYFRIRSKGNHEIVAQSEGYTTKAACLHGLRLVHAGPIYEV